MTRQNAAIGDFANIRTWWDERKKVDAFLDFVGRAKLDLENETGEANFDANLIYVLAEQAYRDQQDAYYLILSDALGLDEEHPWEESGWRHETTDFGAAAKGHGYHVQIDPDGIKIYKL